MAEPARFRLAGRSRAPGTPRCTARSSSASTTSTLTVRVLPSIVMVEVTSAYTGATPVTPGSAAIADNWS